MKVVQKLKTITSIRARNQILVHSINNYYSVSDIKKYTLCSNKKPKGFQNLKYNNDLICRFICTSGGTSLNCKGVDIINYYRLEFLKKIKKWCTMKKMVT